MDLIKKNQDGSYISGWDRVRRTGRQRNMLKIMKTLSLTIMTILIPCSLWGQTVLKIGYVDAQAIAASSTEAASAEEQFQREMVVWESELQSLQIEAEELITQYQTQQATMTPENMAVREELIVRKQQEFQNRAQEIESLAATLRQELYQPLMEKINSIIEEIRQQGDYTFIFNSATGVILSADESLDLTEEVIQRLAAGGL